MKVALQSLAVGGPLLLAAMGAGAQAAPLTRAAGDQAAAGVSSGVTTVASRRCWRHHGKQHCSGYGVQHRVYRYSGESKYYEHDSNHLPFGSQRWWEQMQRENRFGGGGGGKD
jgi:hypothetical protein